MESDKDIYTDPENHLSGIPFVNETRNEGKLHDVVLKAGNLTIPAHRILLANAIPYFKEMFLSNMANSNQREIVIEEIDPKVLQSLIEFVYTGKIKINTSNVKDIMIGSSFLQLDKVLYECEKFLKR